MRPVWGKTAVAPLRKIELTFFESENISREVWPKKANRSVKFIRPEHGLVSFVRCAEWLRTALSVRGCPAAARRFQFWAVVAFAQFAVILIFFFLVLGVL